MHTHQALATPTSGVSYNPQAVTAAVYATDRDARRPSHGTAPLKICRAVPRRRTRDARRPAPRGTPGRGQGGRRQRGIRLPGRFNRNFRAAGRAKGAPQDRARRHSGPGGGRRRHGRGGACRGGGAVGRPGAARDRVAQAQGACRRGRVVRVVRVARAFGARRGGGGREKGRRGGGGAARAPPAGDARRGRRAPPRGGQAAGGDGIRLWARHRHCEEGGVGKDGTRRRGRARGRARWGRQVGLRARGPAQKDRQGRRIGRCC